MPAKVAHHAVAVLLGMLLDGGAHIAQPCPGLCSLYADVTALPGHLHQALHFGADFPNHIHARCVGEIPFVDGGHVYVYNISAAQEFLCAGDAVAHHIVNADAYALRKAFVQEGSGNGVVVCRKAVYHVVYLCRGHSLADILRDVIEQGGVYPCAFAYACQLLFRTQQMA